MNKKEEGFLPGFEPEKEVIISNEDNKGKVDQKVDIKYQPIDEERTLCQYCDDSGPCKYCERGQIEASRIKHQR